MWHSSLSFVLGRREPCGCSNAQIQALPRLEFLLVLTFLSQVKSMPKLQFLLRIRSMTVIHSWTSASPLLVKTSFPSPEPGAQLCQKPTQTWIFKRHLLAHCLFPRHKLTVKSVPSFFSIFFLKEPAHSVSGICGVLPIRASALTWQAGSSSWLARSPVSACPPLWSL